MSFTEKSLNIKLKQNKEVNVLIISKPMDFCIINCPKTRTSQRLS